MVKLKTIDAKNFMTKTGLGHDFVCNPYGGCEHGCLYCYAQTMPSYLSRVDKWGTYVDIKKYPNYNIPRNTGSKSLIFSSMTDAYQPIEATIKNTQTILNNIFESNLQVSFLTKSALITRDINLFQQMKSVEIGFSIATNDYWASIFEPKASKPSERIEALKILHQTGIITYVFISPIIPFVTNVFEIIDSVKPYVDYFMFDKLNLKDINNKKRIFQVIQHQLPNKYNEFVEIFETSKQDFYVNLKNEIESYIKKENLSVHYLY